MRSRGRTPLPHLAVAILADWAGGDLALRRCVFRSESTGAEAVPVGSDIRRLRPQHVRD